MKDRFSDIVDLSFTARMEESLDSIEKGARDWRSVLADFYGGFKSSIDAAETALEGERIKIPDEMSDEICDRCGRQMVVKAGRFGRFLACPGYPECNFTKPLVIEMPGRCPKCGSRILKRTSKNGYTYYACEKLKECGFMTWDVPVKDNCPECGQSLFKKSGKGFMKPFCINEACPNFLPEDKRGYKKKTETETPESEAAKQPTEVKPTSRAAAKAAGGAAKPVSDQAAKKKAPAAKSAAKKTKQSTAKKETKRSAAAGKEV